MFLARRGCDSHRYAVHVHFAIADLVEPCPCQSIICRRDGIRDCEVELIGSVSERVGTYVAGVTGWTTALDGFDHFEDGVCRWWCVAREGDLAGTSAVGGLTLKADGLEAVDRHYVPLCDVVHARTLFAGPVRAVCFERVGIERCGAVRDWLLQLHVCMGKIGDEDEPGWNCKGVEMHFMRDLKDQAIPDDCVMRIFVWLERVK